MTHGTFAIRNPFLFARVYSPSLDARIALPGGGSMVAINIYMDMAAQKIKTSDSAW
jgi:hypothetical protein